MVKIGDQVKCVKIEVGEDEFTIGKVYEVTGVDNNGDVWVICDDGSSFFFYPSECELVK